MQGRAPIPLRSGRGECQFRLAVRADVASASTDSSHTGILVLPHGTEYNIALSSREEGDATIRIDGAVVGTFRVPPGREIIVDRPVDVARRLTFYLVGTPEARAAALDEDDAQLGLVTADFIPAMPSTEPYRPPYKSLPYKSMYTNFSGLDAARGATSSRGSDGWHDNLAWGRRGGGIGAGGARGIGAGSAEGTGAGGARGIGAGGAKGIGAGGARGIGAGSLGETTFENSTNFVAGGTGLGQSSDQRFGDARSIVPDRARAVRRAIRIVGPVGPPDRTVLPSEHADDRDTQLDDLFN